MEKFFQYFKEKLSLNDEHLYQLRNIILNDNTALIKQNFEFKKKLLSVISSKLISYEETNKHITNFFGYINLDLLNSNDVNELKYKLLLLNNLYDLSMKYIEKDKKNKNNNKDKNDKVNLLNIFFGYFINSLEKKEFSFLLIY